MFSFVFQDTAKLILILTWKFKGDLEEAGKEEKSCSTCLTRNETYFKAMVIMAVCFWCKKRKNKRIENLEVDTSTYGQRNHDRGGGR